MNYDVPRHDRTKEATNIRDKLKAKFSKLRDKYPQGELFIADDELKLCVSIDVVGRWIATSNVDVIDKDRIRTQIWSSALKTFCILVEIERENAIKYFIECGRTDTWLRSWSPESLKEFINDASPQQASGKWLPAKCKEFFEEKWKYMPIHFTVGDDVTLEDKMILPFRMIKPHQASQGGSRLFEVEFDGRFLKSEKGDHGGPHSVILPP